MATETHEKLPEQIKYEPLFNLVQPKDNWKNPINALVDPMDLVELNATKQDLNDAIVFYAGGPVTITREGSKLHVTAPGYYVAIGA